MYVIHMKNCAFFARHGVHDEEEFLGQRFYVDAVLNGGSAQAVRNALAAALGKAIVDSL